MRVNIGTYIDIPVLAKSVAAWEGLQACSYNQHFMTEWIQITILFNNNKKLDF